MLPKLICKPKRFAPSLLLLTLLTGCSGKPGDGELNSQVLPLLQSESLKNTVEVRNLHKTNGYETSSNTYTLDIAYNLVFKANFADLAKEFDNSSRGTRDSDIMGGKTDLLGDGFALLGMHWKYGDFKVGDTFTQVDRITFINTENGWKLSSQPKSVFAADLVKKK